MAGSKWRSAISAAVLAALAASPVLADALDDARAGLDALNRGDNAGGVRLFTQALNAASLSRADQELAYVKRAQANLALGQTQAALADAAQAAAIDPNDAEAADVRSRALALAQAQAQAAVQAQQAPAPTSFVINVCNHNANTVSVAVKSQEIGSNRWKSEGWWNIASGTCMPTTSTANTYFYVFGKVKGLIYAGKMNGCIGLGSSFKIYEDRLFLNSCAWKVARFFEQNAGSIPSNGSYYVNLN